MSMEREVTIYDLATKLEISPATVSRALQDHPAISKKTKKKGTRLAKVDELIILIIYSLDKIIMK